MGTTTMATTSSSDERSTLPIKDALATTNTKNNMDYEIVGSKNCVMKLFSLPYSKKALTVGIHNVEGCLLLEADPHFDDRFESEKGSVEFDKNRKINASKTEQKALLEAHRASVVQAALPQSEALSLLHSMIEAGEIGSIESELELYPDETTLFLEESNLEAESFERSTAEPREYLPWNFSGMKFLVGSNALVYRSTPETSLTIRVEDAAVMRKQLENREKSLQNERDTRRSYAEALMSQDSTKQRESASKNEDTGNAGKINSSQLFRGNQTTNSSSPVGDEDLNSVRLHTSIIPANNYVLGGKFSTTREPPPNSDQLSSPMYTMIDAYLDQLITAVPQLALVLREKGFVQSVKLLETAQIPEAFLQAKTFDTSKPFEIIGGIGAPHNAQTPSVENEFDPNLMQMNAASLLSLIKANCTKDNATYLLHREAGQTNIQLFDATAISETNQRKWMMWLAMMSHRFSHRLHTMADQPGISENAALRRTFRSRERTLLENTISLMEDLSDMGSPHESMMAEICEKVADTYLFGDVDPRTTDLGVSSSERNGCMAAVCSVGGARFQRVKPDALCKAQSYLERGVKILWNDWKELLLEIERTCAEKPHRGGRRRGINPVQPNKVESISADFSSSDEEEGDNVSNDDCLNISLDVKLEALATQLFALHDKSIDISLRLTEHHLHSYWSSSAMQALRTAARKLADCTSIYNTITDAGSSVKKERILTDWLNALQQKYVRTWELCGNFARSFASDDLWRERGHAAGDDIIAVLNDVFSAFPSETTLTVPRTPVADVIFFPQPGRPRDMKSYCSDLSDLSGIVDSDSVPERDVVEARKFLDAKRQLQRDKRRVLVAACSCFKRALSAYEASINAHSNAGRTTTSDGGLLAETNDSLILNRLRKRLGDANNELGKVMLNELKALLVALQQTDAALGLEAAKENAAVPLLTSAHFWFSEGLKLFELSNDSRNCALVRCNICQCFKLKANSIFSNHQEMDNAGPTKHSDSCLSDAIDQLQEAHRAIGEREIDQVTWDMVSNELAASLLVLGVRRRQGLLSGARLLLQATRISPGQARSIVEPMERALAIYEQSGNVQQAAAVHYQMALYYSKVWTSQRDESKTREMLSAAFLHFKAAHTYFIDAIPGNEQSFVLLCLDLASLYSTVSGEECLCRALLCCVDTRNAFTEGAIDIQRSSPSDKVELLKTMATLATSVEDRVFMLLKSLVKLNNSSKYKDIYREALTAKMTAATAASDEKKNSTAMQTAVAVLQAVQQNCKVLMHS